MSALLHPSSFKLLFFHYCTNKPPTHISDIHHQHINKRHTHPNKSITTNYSIWQGHRNPHILAHKSASETHILLIIRAKRINPLVLSFSFLCYCTDLSSIYFLSIHHLHIVYRRVHLHCLLAFTPLTPLNFTPHRLLSISISSLTGISQNHKLQHGGR